MLEFVLEKKVENMIYFFVYNDFEFFKVSI